MFSTRHGPTNYLEYQVTLAAFVVGTRYQLALWLYWFSVWIGTFLVSLEPIVIRNNKVNLLIVIRHFFSYWYLRLSSVKCNYYKRGNGGRLSFLVWHLTSRTITRARIFFLWHSIVVGTTTTKWRKIYYIKKKTKRNFIKELTENWLTISIGSQAQLPPTQQAPKIGKLVKWIQ